MQLFGKILQIFKTSKISTYRQLEQSRSKREVMSNI